MTSKSKEVTGNTPPSSSAENTEVLAQPSKQSASSDNTPNSTPILKKPSENTLTTGEKGLTTPPTTEKTRQHAMLAKVILHQLSKAGLIKRFRVLSAESGTVQKIRIEFDMSLWTEDLELK